MKLIDTLSVCYWSWCALLSRFQYALVVLFIFFSASYWCAIIGLPFTIVGWLLLPCDGIVNLILTINGISALVLWCAIEGWLLLTFDGTWYSHALVLWCAVESSLMLTSDGA